MNNDILLELQSTKTKLLDTIAAFKKEDFNSIPFEGSWTAAQVSEHILKFVSGTLQLLYGPVQPTNRDHLEKVSEIRGVFLDFSIKMKSPEFVLPGDAPMENKKLHADLEHTFEKIVVAINTLDIAPTCTAFELPGTGTLTRAEWIWFSIYHTQRHTRQLKNIYTAINNRQHALK